MLPMRTPDEDGSGEDTVSTSVGDGFGASADDLEDGFGDDDFSDDTSFGDDTGDTTTVGTDEGSFGDDTGDGGDTPFGDGLSDAEAENVLVEILEDVFGSDTEALDEVDSTDAGDGGAGTGSGDGGVFEAFDGTTDEDDGGSFVDTFNGALGDDGGSAVVDDFDPFEPSDIPSGDDFDLTRDGRVDVHDLHEAAHPFDFGISE